MLQNFKKLFNNSESGEAIDISPLSAWAEQKGFALKRVRDAFGGGRHPRRTARAH
jgi:hypothetical protein